MLDRYQRQEILPGVGAEGQERLRRAKVLVVGLGGLGAPAALYLAGAGVGVLGLADADEVNVSNLHRQILYRERDAGWSKVDVAVRELGALNVDVEVRAHHFRVGAENVDELVASYDVVVDGIDELATRYLIHDACHRLGKTYVFGAVFQLEGQVAVFSPGPGQRPCLRCLFAETPGHQPTSCVEAGTLGPVAGLIGCLQAVEALKCLLPLGESQHGRLLTYDASSARMRSLAFERRDDCALCGVAASARLKVAHDSADRVMLADFVAALPRTRVIDLRTEAERVPGTLPGARAVAPAELDAQAESWGREDSILLYCQRGARSQAALTNLRARGFHGARHLKGGYEAYRRGDAWVVS